MICPYNDDYMTYDYNLHRYVLTEKAYYIYLGINFGELPIHDANPSAVAMREAFTVSEIVYRFLTKDSLNADWLIYELATYERLRSVVFNMLLKQAEYISTSGNMEAYSGIDAFNGERVKRGVLRDVTVSPAVVDIADTVQPILGRCLTYRGYFGHVAPDYFDKDGKPIY